VSETLNVYDTEGLVATIHSLRAEVSRLVSRNAELEQALRKADACWVGDETGAFLMIPRAPLETIRTLLLPSPVEPQP
jgi:hypothetical protein